MTSRTVLGVLLGSMLAGLAIQAGAQTSADVERRVYLTAVDQRGGPITDLTAADLTIREGGRDRPLTALEHSRDRLKVALVVDELLSGDVLIRRAVLRFRELLQDSGDLALYLVGRRNEKRVDYTSEFAPFLNAVNEFPIRPIYPGNLVEALFEIAKEQRTIEGRRVIVVLAPEMGQISSITANAVLDELRAQGSVLYSATLVGVSRSGGSLIESPTTRLEGGDLTAIVERDRVLNDGPKQSGGIRIPSMNVEAFAASLDRIAGELRNQYVATYVLPAGTKSDGRIEIRGRRRGATVRGPNRLPGL